MVLAGSLSSTNPESSKAPSIQQDAKAEIVASKRKESWEFVIQIMAIYFCRFFLIPSAAFFLISFLKSSSPLFSNLFSDSLLVFILLLESCMPSAQNTTVILQLAGDRTGAARIAKALLTLYITGVPALTFWLAKIISYTELA